MAGLTISCPKCQAPLKLKDRSLLGKTGKCPRCAHRFVLQEEEDVALELVNPAAPVEGKNATWIPDQPSPAPPVTQPTAQNPLAGLFNEPAPANDDNPLGFLSGDAIPSTATPESATGLAGIGGNSPAPPVVSRRRKKKRRSSGGMTIAALAILAAAGVGGFLYYKSTQPRTTTPSVAESSPPAQPVPVASTPAAAPRVAAFHPIKELSPTSGRPIQLFNMPAGVRLVINLHPAQLWSNDRQYAEFRASLGPLGTWMESQIQELTRQPPAAIEELMIGLILGPRGTEPEIAAVVHLAQPQQRADLLQIYQGQSHDEFSTDIKVANGKAYRIVDDQTIAICPELYVDDLKTFEKSPAMTSDHLQEMLKSTDRDRLVSIVFDPADIDQHLQTLFPAGAVQVMEKTLRWLSEDAWAAAWSLHVSDDFYTDLIVQPRNDVGPVALSKMYQQRLDVLPELLLTSVQKMNPQRSGYRKLIGRFPAMTKVLALATTVAVDGRLVRMGTLLPAKAGPNLALGTLLTWDESTRTDFSIPVAAATPQTMDRSQLPLQERLQVKMDVDFRRTPLQEAFAFIADESKIPIEIDGDALKLAGFTKNMPQTFAREQATTLEAIYGIIQRYESEAIPLAIHINEANNQILVLTTKVAEERGLNVFDFKANGIQ